ncbi:hypothetical protein NKG05_21265 [Oerskovia sp. M15]
MIDEVTKRLSARGFTFVENLPKIDPQFVLFTSQDVVKAQRAVAFLNTAANVLPWLSLLVAAGAVWAARAVAAVARWCWWASRTSSRWRSSRSGSRSAAPCT